MADETHVSMAPDMSENDEVTLADILEEIQAERASAMRWRIAFFVVAIIIAICVGNLLTAVRGR